MFRLYIIGIFILLIAIIANGLVSKLNIKTWYDFFEILLKSDKLWSTIKPIDFLWLFVIYPLILGLGYKVGEIIYYKIF
jgi:hypothetical protein